MQLAWDILAWCFRELKVDAHRARLLKQLTAILDASEKCDSQGDDARAIFDHARAALNDIYTGLNLARSA